MSDLKLYYMAECPYCQVVLKTLDTYGLTCELLPRSNNAEKVKELSGGSVPVLVAGDEVVSGTQNIVSKLSEIADNQSTVPGNKYGIQTEFDGSMEEAEEAVTAALKEVGFGVLTRIDVAATLKMKLDLDRAPYVILGACNPKIAAQALEMEPDLGLLLPCNVVVRQNSAGKTEIAAVHPIKMLGVVGRGDMLVLAEQVMGLMKQVIAAVASK